MRYNWDSIGKFPTCYYKKIPSMLLIFHYTKTLPNLHHTKLWLDFHYKKMKSNVYYKKLAPNFLYENFDVISPSQNKTNTNMNMGSHIH
jgi:hypothetical protein